MIHVVRNTKCRNTVTLARTRLQNAWRDARMVTRARRYRRRRGRALCMRSLRHRAATLGGFDASRCGARRAGVNQKYVRATVVRCDGIGADARKTVFFVNFNFQLFRKQSFAWKGGERQRGRDPPKRHSRASTSSATTQQPDIAATETTDGGGRASGLGTRMYVFCVCILLGASCYARPVSWMKKRFLV